MYTKSDQSLSSSTTVSNSQGGRSRSRNLSTTARRIRSHRSHSRQNGTSGKRRSTRYWAELSSRFAALASWRRCTEWKNSLPWDLERRPIARQNRKAASTSSPATSADAMLLSIAVIHGSRPIALGTRSGSITSDNAIRMPCHAKCHQTCRPRAHRRVRQSCAAKTWPTWNVRVPPGLEGLDECLTGRPPHSHSRPARQ